MKNWKQESGAETEYPLLLLYMPLMSYLCRVHMYVAQYLD